LCVEGDDVIFWAVDLYLEQGALQVEAIADGLKKNEYGKYLLKMLDGTVY